MAIIGIMIIIRLLLFAISRITLPDHASPAMGNLQNLQGLPLSIPFGLFILTTFGALLAVILMASSIGNEYNWRTIRIELISSEGRLKFLVAKLISVAILILIGMAIGLATSFVMSLITNAIGGNSFDFSFVTGGYLWDQFLQFWRTFFILLPFTLLGFLFSVIGRSAMPGIAVGIGILFLESIITSFMRLAGGWIANIPDYLFTANVNAINALNKLPAGFGMGLGGASSQAPSIPHAFIVLSVYIVIFIGVAFFLFHKRDVTG